VAAIIFVGNNWTTEVRGLEANVKRLQILIADDHALVRRGISGVLRSQHGWKIVGEAANGREAVEKAIKLKPDVAVIDIGMPVLDGIEVTRQIREDIPDTKVLILTDHESDEMVRRAFDAGASGYLFKSDPAEYLLKAVKVIIEGKHFLTPKVLEIVLRGSLKSGNQPGRNEQSQCQLSPREAEITRLLVIGKANKEIAAALGISVRTVETHRSRIMLKLGFHSLAELIQYAYRLGMVSTRRGDTPRRLYQPNHPTALGLK
jgi:two-component system, NarL family, response regulator NreC